MTRAPVVRAMAALPSSPTSLLIALTMSAAPRSRPARRHPDRAWRPETPRPSRPTPRPPTAPWRCCAAAPTRSAWSNPPWSAPASGASSSNCPACRTRARPPPSSARPPSSPSTRSSACRRRRARRRRGSDPGRRVRAALRSARPRSPATASSDAEARIDPQRARAGTSPSTSASTAEAWAKLTGEAACAPGRRPEAPGRHRPRQQGHLLAAGGPGRAPARGHPRRLHADHRLLHRGGGQGPGPADQGRRPAGAASRPSSSGPSARRSAPRPSRPAPRPRVIGVILTALFIIVVYRLIGAARHRRPGLLRPHLLRRAGGPRRHPHPARPGRVRAGDRHGGRRQRAGLRTGPRGVRRAPAAACRRPCDRGFRNAWSAIADSNITTLLAAGLLFFLASGPVRGLRRHAGHRRGRLAGLGAW